MKIAFVAQPIDGVLPPRQNSIGIIIYEIARRLAGSCSVSVYLRGGRIRKRVENVEGVDYRFIPIGPDRLFLPVLGRISHALTSKHPLFVSRLYYMGYILQVAKDLRTQDYDIVHVMNFSQFVPIIRAFNQGSKIVLHMGCEWLTQLDRYMIEKRLTDVDLIIGCSDYITSKVRKAFPSIAARCRVVHNGVDIHHFKPQNGTVPRKRDSSKRLLYVGRISPEKGIHTLLEAFEKVVQRHPDAYLDLIGSKLELPLDFLLSLSDDQRVAQLRRFYHGNGGGTYFSHLQDYLTSSDLANRVRFRGSIPHRELRSHYNSADVLINPSLSEAFGISLIEAMACEVPAVATRVGGMTEIVDNNRTGRLVGADDADSLASTIVSLLSDAGRRKSMGMEGRKRAVELFSWDRICQDYLSAVRDIHETSQ